MIPEYNINTRQTFHPSTFKFHYMLKVPWFTLYSIYLTNTLLQYYGYLYQFQIFISHAQFHET